MIDPIELAKIIENHVRRVNAKKFYRFRKTRFYGGCATADCLGCNLRCVYCWAQKKVWNPKRFGQFYTPQQVSKRLITMNSPLIRVSGGEPTIFKKFLVDLLTLIPKHITFILETNGILLNNDYVKSLSRFKNLYVRVSLKGVNEQTFESITGAKGKFFHNQIIALELLKNFGIPHRAAILYDLFTDDQIETLRIPDIEYETLIRYPFVLKNLYKKDIHIKR